MQNTFIVPLSLPETVQSHSVVNNAHSTSLASLPGYSIYCRMRNKYAQQSDASEAPQSVDSDELIHAQHQFEMFCQYQHTESQSINQPSSNSASAQDDLRAVLGSNMNEALQSEAIQCRIIAYGVQCKCVFS